VSSWLGLLVAGGGTDRDSVLDADRGDRRDPEDGAASSRLPLPDRADVFSGTFFPVTRCRSSSSWSYVTPIWHGVESPDAHARRRRAAAAGHAPALLTWTIVGFELARRAYRKRLLG
jgi:hypothetical protein